MDEHELGLQRDRALEQLALGGYSGDDRCNRLAAGDLEAVRAHVVKRTGIQQLVEERDHFGDTIVEVSNGMTTAILSIER